MLPTHTTVGFTDTVGLGTTVIESVHGEEHPVEVCVHRNETLPGAKPVTKPELLIVAIEVLLDCHVPPELGSNVVVVSTQIVSGPVRVVVGLAVTVTLSVSEVHPVEVSVNTNRPIPAEIPVTKPALVTVAIVGFTAVHVPPVVGDSVVVDPIHTAAVPVIVTVGLGLTVTGPVVLVQPVAVFVKVKVAVPVDIAVTTPVVAFTVATAGLLLCQVPPVFGVSVVVFPIHIADAPLIPTVGRGLTVICMVSEQEVVA